MELDNIGEILLLNILFISSALREQKSILIFVLDLLLLFILLFFLLESFNLSLQTYFL